MRCRAPFPSHAVRLLHYQRYQELWPYLYSFASTSKRERSEGAAVVRFPRYTLVSEKQASEGLSTSRDRWIAIIRIGCLVEVAPAAAPPGLAMCVHIDRVCPAHRIECHMRPIIACLNSD